MIKKGSFIEIEKIGYDNKKSDAKVFVRGICLSNCDMGQLVKIQTITGHREEGVVTKHDFFYENGLRKTSKEILFIRKSRK